MGHWLYCQQNIIHICSECFTACLCQYSNKSTPRFMINRDGSSRLEMSSAFIQATGSNSQPYLCIVRFSMSKYFWSYILGCKDWLLQLQELKDYKQKRFLTLHQTFYNCYSWLTSLDSNRTSDHSYMHNYLLKIYSGHLRGFPALDIHETWNVYWQWVLLNVFKPLLTYL